MKQLSIITINRNNAAGLKRTIDSVIAQECKNFQYIIIDGLSSDNSWEIILDKKNIQDWICISEQDSGIYEAMNKGLRIASGDYCLFLNSGDWLVSKDTIATLYNIIDDAHDVYYSDLLVSNCETSHCISYPKNITVDYLLNNTISHQNSIIKTSLLRAVGGYNEDFKIVSDWYFYLFIAHRQLASFWYLEKPITYYFHEGMSNRIENDRVKEKEHTACIELEFGALAKPVLELIQYRSSIYGKLIIMYNRPSSLEFVLRCYRYLARRFPWLTKKKYSSSVF